jgi:two-component system cell cycle response regulator
MAPLARILLAHDDAELAGTLTTALTGEGYDVTAAPAAADDLLAALAGDAYDLLVLETASGDAGLELLARLQADGRHEALPMLVLSPLPAAEGSGRALGLGAADFLTRPFAVADVVARAKARLRAGRELNLARAEARSRSELIEILREIASSLSPEEIYAVLGISRCSILIRGDDPGAATVVAAFENPMLRNLRVDLRRYPEIRQAFETGEIVLSDSIDSDPIFAATREEWRRTGTQVETTSALVIPFTLGSERVGVFYLRTTGPVAVLNRLDVRFADQVIRSAATTIERAYQVQEAFEGHRELRALADTDPLTGLANRRALEARLARELEQAARYPTALSCLMVDVDEFKALNDTWGHQAGDQVLTQLAALFQREQRALDLVARMGGEEFCILLPLTGSAGARLFADRILRRVAGHAFGSAQRPLSVTVSIGIATWPDDRITDGASFLDLADQNLLKAKADGRNRYRD